MRERARDKGRLEDILEYSDNVTKFINCHTFVSLHSKLSNVFDFKTIHQTSLKTKH